MFLKSVKIAIVAISCFVSINSFAAYYHKGPLYMTCDGGFSGTHELDLTFDGRGSGTVDRVWSQYSDADCPNCTVEQGDSGIITVTMPNDAIIMFTYNGNYSSGVLHPIYGPRNIGSGPTETINCTERDRKMFR